MAQRTEAQIREDIKAETEAQHEATRVLLSDIEAGVRVINTDLSSVESAAKNLTTHTNQVIGMILLLDGNDFEGVGRCTKIIGKVAKPGLRTTLQNLLNNSEDVKYIRDALATKKVSENITGNTNVFPLVASIAKVDKSESLTLDSLVDYLAEQHASKVQKEIMKPNGKGDVSKVIINSGDMSAVNNKLNKIDEIAATVDIQEVTDVSSLLASIAEQEEEVIEKLFATESFIKNIKEIHATLNGYNLISATEASEKAS